MSATADTWKKQLKLKPHPEGGYYAETYRSDVELRAEGMTRSLATSIYYMLEGPDKSHWHQLASDELWFFHDGETVELHLFVDGEYENHYIGRDTGTDPQIVIPAGAVFAARCKSVTGFSLLGCVVSPGFDFEDFRLVPADELIEIFPEEETLIREFAKME